MEKSFSQSFTIEGRNFSNAGRASTEIKGILKQLGLNSGVIRKVAIAMYEAEMNVAMYAQRATMTFEVSPRWIKVVVDDEGPGIPDIDLAMQEGYSTATVEMREMGFGAGMGLPNIKRNSDEFAIQSVVGRGTRVEITVYIN
jgi:anti-sigma regulatory factor (Ser/Thr protein kinase)